MKRILVILGVLVMSLGALHAQEADEPFITVSPTQFGTVTAHVGDTVRVGVVHIRQGHLSGPTYLYLTGYFADQFRLSAYEMPANVGELDLVITYQPTKTGTHTAILNIDNYHHTALFQSISVKGMCKDESLHPTLTVTPSEMPEFTTHALEEVTQTFTVTSSECLDFVYLHVEHIEGAAFTINTSMLAKNSTDEISVRFAPMAEGTYQSTVTAYTQGAESVVLTLNGVASAPDPDVTTWQTEFVWEPTEALTYMEETFDSIRHNKPLKLKGWQNVAAADERPWWGYDESIVPQWMTEGSYAKATSYQFGLPMTDTWDMWLVTPLLDYKNTVNKIFAFSVMGEYMPDEGSEETFLEIYYMEPDSGNVLIQDLTDFFDLPKRSEENRLWVTYHLDLSPYAETMADAFYMAFRYVGPNGADGAITYYLDDVSWGAVEEAVIDIVEPNSVRCEKRLLDGQVVIVRGDKMFDILGKRLR